MRNRSRTLLLSAAIGLALAVTGGSALHAADLNPPGAAATSAEQNADKVYIITFVEEGLLNYQGGVAGLARTAPDRAAKQRLDRTTAAARGYEAFLDQQRRAYQAQMEATLQRSLDVTHSYGITFNGVATELEPEEVAQLAALPGIKSVEPAGVYHLDTYRGPSFIGADQVWSGSVTPDNLPSRGEGVVVGVLDGGAASNHPSFANDATCGFSAANPKLVAVDCSSSSGGICTGSNPEANSGFGHGVHTASTVAGNTIDNTVSPAPALPDDVTMSGVAPCAAIHQYKVCQTDSCSGAHLAAGIENAIADNVDVINFSISGGTNPWSTSDNDRRFLDAVDNGTFVAASAGNTSDTQPTPEGRVNHRGPWVMTVAASTQDIFIGPGLSLADAGAPAAAQGIPLNPGSTTPISATPDWSGKPIVFDAGNSEGCNDAGGFAPGTFDDAIALIIRGTCAFSEKIQNAYDAGADMVVIANNEVGGINMDTTGAPNVPAYSVSQAAGIALSGAIDANSTADVSPIHVSNTPGDVIADFSFRGPIAGNLSNLTKPDISGPGVDIFAATDPGSGDYEYMSGTSMSGPHVAGAGALVKSVHMDWSPMEIRSALMTTAKPDGYMEDETTPWNIDVVGSGRVQVDLAVQAGLTLDETKANFLASNPTGGNNLGVTTLNIPALRNMSCSSGCSWTRTVRNRLDSDGHWTIDATTDGRFEIVASPASFELAVDDTQTITFTAWPTTNISGTAAFGYVELTEADGKSPQQHFTIAVRGNAATTYAVGGTVNGLSGSGLSLQLNGGTAFPVATNGSYTAPVSLPDGLDYTVSIATQPAGQECVVDNASGTIAGSDVSDVDVTCVTAVIPAQISVAPGSLSQMLEPGQTGVQTLVISNAGDEDLTWEIAEEATASALLPGGDNADLQGALDACTNPGSVSWLAEAPLAGVTAGGDSDSVMVAFDADGLTDGSYTANLCVTSNDADNPVVAVPVELTVVTSMPVTWTLTPTIGSGNGTITPDTPQTVVDGDSAWFVLTPDAGYHLDSVGGSCDGTLAGNVYTVDAVDASCDVIANFAQDPVTFDLSLFSGRDYARYGQQLTYLVSLTNTGTVDIDGAAVSMTLSPELDGDAASWMCIGAAAGADCIAQGQGPLLDPAVVLPAQRTLNWLVTIPVLTDSDGATAESSAQVSYQGTDAGQADEVTLVLLRTGFDALYDDGAQGRNGPEDANACADRPTEALDDAFVHSFSLPAAGMDVFDTVLTMAGERGESVRIERANLGVVSFVRLVATDANGKERASAWAEADAGTSLTLGTVEAEAGRRLLLLEGSHPALRLLLPEGMQAARVSAANQSCM